MVLKFIAPPLLYDYIILPMYYLPPPNSSCMYVCVDGWMDGWMHGWMDGWMHVCMYI